MTGSFDAAWAAVSGEKQGEQVSPELRPLLNAVYAAIVTEPCDLKVLKSALADLLRFLAGPGRTNANCWAVDSFFGMSEGWESDWVYRNLPEDFHDVLAMMGEALHDAVDNPKVASNFDCLPEQLLDRVVRLHT
jgi:hypothetical protein